MRHLSAGTLFANRFEIDRTAGSGGMGTVYRARNRYSGDWVALKLLQGGSVDDAARFTREAELLSELRHPGIVAYVAHGQAPDGQRWFRAVSNRWFPCKPCSIFGTRHRA